MGDPLAPTRRLLQFIDASPTPFHAVRETITMLEAAGYTRVREEDPWTIPARARHYITRNDSTLVAFEIGSSAPAEAGFMLIGAHTDSPNLRLKPNAAYAKEGYRQLGVEVYGGVLLVTWLDRDLSLAGRVLIAGEDQPRLLKIDRPVCRIPNLAIHLNREANEKFTVNQQKHLPPMIGLSPEGATKDDDGWLPALLCRELGLPEATDVLGFDLMLYDVTPGALCGADEEFITIGRLDNLASCHAALEALVEAGAAPSPATRVIALYDNEEVGSQSAEGADSPFLASVLERVTLGTGGSTEDVHRALARSLFVSADMAHAVHPNYADLHEPRHMPKLNGGPVLKVNSNLRYATNARTANAFAGYAREVDVPLQRFVSRTDLRCGSTIGPITASRLGIPTLDVGNPMLSMHSVREMAGSRDHEMMIKVMKRHFA